jgi:hypothetical protein
MCGGAEEIARVVLEHDAEAARRRFRHSMKFQPNLKPVTCRTSIAIHP